MESDGNLHGLLLDFQIKAIHDGVIYIYQDDDTLKAYETDDHALKLMHETAVNYPIPAAINGCALRFFDDEPVIAASSILAFNSTTELSRFNKDMTEKKWSVSLPINFQNKGKAFLMPAEQISFEHDVLAVTTNRTVSFVDYETGDLIKNLPIEMIINREIDRIAKNYNHFYNNIKLITADETGTVDNAAEDPEIEWNRLRLFRRSSSKAAAYHDEVKNDILPKLAAENGVRLEQKLEELIGTDGTLMRYTGSAWQMHGTEEEVLKKIREDSFAYGLASLEHRRWCCYMASIGWRPGERSDQFRRNPCLVPQQKLMQDQPEMCKYDLMSLMERYKKELESK
ncbi:MAG: hypothetical protein IKG82_04415 [Oscillospiraceae bacterium]|nr:hypothetical protein [Oscillospiraceae bacterium]